MPNNTDRLVAILKLTTQRETTDFLWDKRRRDRNFLRNFHNDLQIPGNHSSDFQYINSLEKYFDDLRNKATDDDMTFECIDCGGVSEAKGLRWDLLNKGKPLTVSIDHRGKPRPLTWLTDAEIMEHWFKPWTDENSNIKFQLLTSGRGHCHITFEPIDGPNGTLKFVWQPTEGEFMEDGGEPSGNMVCDSSEQRYPRPLVRVGGKHEVGHVLGIGHLSAKKDVMYPTAENKNKPLSTNDIRERNERYPTNDKPDTTKPA